MGLSGASALSGLCHDLLRPFNVCTTGRWSLFFCARPLGLIPVDADHRLFHFVGLAAPAGGFAHAASFRGMIRTRYAASSWEELV